MYFKLTHKAPGFAEAVADLVRNLPERFEFARELDGIAAQTGIDIVTLMAGNLWLETGGMGCSTMVSRTDAGEVGGESGVQVPYLIRTMDWQIPEFRIGTLQIKFARKGKVLFIATTHTGFIGMITASSASFGVSVNHRREDDVHGDKIKRRQAQLTRVVDAVRLGLAPVSFFVREMMERASSYDEAVALARTTDLMAPCYINLVGTVADEGCVISRAPITAESDFPIWYLAALGPTCQTNSDIFDSTAIYGAQTDTGDTCEVWVPAEAHDCARRRVAEAELARLAQDGRSLTPSDMWGIMRSSLINNPETIFTTAMSPATGHYVSIIGEEKAAAALKPCLTDGCEFLGVADMNGFCSDCYIRIALGGDA